MPSAKEQFLWSMNIDDLFRVPRQFHCSLRSWFKSYHLPQPPPAHGYSSGHLATACDKVCSYGKTYSRSSRPVTTTEAWNQKGWRDLHSAGLCSHRVILGREGCSKSWPPVTIVRRITYLESSMRSCFPGWWQVLPIRQQGANLCSADLTQCKLEFKVIGANKAICWQISSESYKCCPSSGSDSLR